jgi:hypothetical protein
MTRDYMGYLYDSKGILRAYGLEGTPGEVSNVSITTQFNDLIPYPLASSVVLLDSVAKTATCYDGNNLSNINWSLNLPSAPIGYTGCVLDQDVVITFFADGKVYALTSKGLLIGPIASSVGSFPLLTPAGNGYLVSTAGQMAYYEPTSTVYGLDLGGNNKLTLSGVGEVKIGAAINFYTRNCIPNTMTGALFYAQAQGFYPNFGGVGGTLLLDVNTLNTAALGTADSSGVITNVVAVPNNPMLVGVTVDLQSVAFDPSNLIDIRFSNGLEATIH